MGGNAFENVSMIKISELYDIWNSQIYEKLVELGCADITPTGTTFKKQYMGDIDVAVSGDYWQIYKNCVDKFGKQNVRRIGSQIISVAMKCFVYDESGYECSKNVQVDIMVGDVKFLSWTHIGTTSIKGDKHYSLFKGSVRQILIDSILDVYSKTKFGFIDDHTKVSYKFDIESGIYEVSETLRGTRGQTLKHLKCVNKTLFLDDPQKIVEFLFKTSCDVHYSNVCTFEDVHYNIKKFLSVEMQREIFEVFKENLLLAGKRSPKRISPVSDVNDVLTKLNTFFL